MGRARRGDYQVVLARLGEKVAAASAPGEDSLLFVLRQTRKAWREFIDLVVAKDRLILQELDTDDIDRILQVKDGELMQLEAHVARLTVKVERGR